MWKFGAVALAAVAALSGCKGGGAKDTWTAVIARCAQSDLNRKPLFLGTSNVLGPGTVWRIVGNTPPDPMLDLGHMPAGQDFLVDGNETSCAGESKKTFKLDVSAKASVPTPAISAEMKADFKNAKTVVAKADTLSWVQVVFVPYRDYVNRNASLKAELEKDNRYVMTRALMVNGYEATVEWSAGVDAGLKAKYDGPLNPSLTGAVDGGVTATWTGDTKLTLKSPGKFFIAGELRPYPDVGLSATDKDFGPPVTLR